MWSFANVFRKIISGFYSEPDETNSHLCKIQFNIILPPIASLPSDLFLGFNNQNFVGVSHFPIHSACPVHIFTHDVHKMLKHSILHKIHIILTNKTYVTLWLFHPTDLQNWIKFAWNITGSNFPYVINKVGRSYTSHYNLTNMKLFEVHTAVNIKNSLLICDYLSFGRY